MKKIRKPKPSVPNWVYLDRDNCYACKNKHGCNNCKLNKKFLQENPILKFKGAKMNKNHFMNN